MNNQVSNDKNKNEESNIIGNLFLAVILGCIGAIVVALTYKVVVLIVG